MIKKTVLVTGACINTGADIVFEFAEQGWDVVFTGRNIETVANREAEYKSRFPKVNFYGYSLSAVLDNGDVNTVGVDNLFSDLDRKGIFVEAIILNAADHGLNMKIFENPVSDFIRVLNTNVVWNYYIVEQASKRMKENGGGSILFINSNTAYRAIPNRIAYEASKGGQLGMMRGLALDLGKYGIRVNAILPGMIKTDRWEQNPEFYENVPSRFTPLGDVAVGKDIAEASYYFAAHARNTTGAELVVDGGNMIQLYPIINSNTKNGEKL